MRRSCCSNFFNTTASAGPPRTNWIWVIHNYATVTFKRIGYVSCSTKYGTMTARFQDHLWPLGRHAALLVYLLKCFSHVLNCSYSHPSVQFERLLRSFTRTGHALFPQVCHSWHFECGTAPLLDMLYMCVRQNQQEEKMCKGRHFERGSPYSPSSPRLGAVSECKPAASAECDFMSAPL